MRIAESTIERMAWWVVFMVLIMNIISVGLITRIISNHTHTLQIETQNTQKIEDNQHTNALAIKTYIACLLNLNSNQTTTQVQAAEMVCFDKAPTVK